MLLLVTINLSFSSPWLHQFSLSLSLFSYPYPCHGWFDTPRCNCLILVSSSCYGCLLLATLPLQYQCTSPFRDCLLLLLVAIFFSSSIHLPVIFFSSSLSLVNITLPILVAIVSSPRRYHFAYPCNNYLLLYLIVFYLSWFLCYVGMTKLGLYIYLGIIMRGNWDSFLGYYFIRWSLIISCIWIILMPNFQYQNKISFYGPYNFEFSSMQTQGLQKFEKCSKYPSRQPYVSEG